MKYCIDAQTITKALVDAAKRNVAPAWNPPNKVKRESQNHKKEDIPILLLSDLQAGLKTKDFDSDVLKARIMSLGEQVKELITEQRKIHNIKKLEVFMLGDMVHGERIGQQMNLAELDDTVQGQIYNTVSPYVGSMLSMLSSHFDELNVRCVTGNHGNVGKMFSSTFNLDDICYRHIESCLRAHKNVHFDISDDFHLMTNVGNTRFLLSHGDAIKMKNSIPYGSILDKALKWGDSIGDFDVMVLGHFHSFCAMDYNKKVVVVNGAFSTGDQFILRTMGLANTSSQVMLFLDSEAGLTSFRKIMLD